MLKKLHVYAIVTTIFIVVLATLWWKNAKNAIPVVIASYTLSVTVLGAVLFAYERWIWAWAKLYPWLTDVPDLRGSWKFHLGGDHAAPNVGKQGDGCVVIRQTASKIGLHILWANGGNTTTVMSPLIRTERMCHFTTTYSFKAANAAAIHGLAVNVIEMGGHLEFAMNQPHAITVEYTSTDRQLSGTLQCNYRTKKLFSDANAAKDAGYLNQLLPPP